VLVDVKPETQVMFTTWRQKKSSGINRCWMTSTLRTNLNGVFNLFIQQLWKDIGSICRKFTSFYGT